MNPLRNTGDVFSRGGNNEARLRLFCLPYAGGGSHIFRDWGDRLSRVEVYPVELPGRASRINEPPLRRMSNLVESVSMSVERYIQQPLALFGHSMGAIISFELAHRLQRLCHVQLTHLFVSGCRAPHVLGRQAPIHELPRSLFLAELRRIHGTPQQVLDDPELMDLLIPTLRADFEASYMYMYYPRSPLRCPITALGGIHDLKVGLADLEAWREHTTSSFSLRMVPGDHFFIHSSQTLLVDILDQELGV